MMPEKVADPERADFVDLVRAAQACHRWQNAVRAVLVPLACVLLLSSTLQSEVFEVPGAPVVIELAAPPELYAVASRSVASTCEAIRQAAGSGALPEGQWRIVIHVRGDSATTQVTVRTLQTTQGGDTREWARSDHTAFDERALGELLQTWIQLALPLQGRITGATEKISEALFPPLSCWSWMHDPRLLPNSGVLLAAGSGGRYRPALVVGRTGASIRVRVLDGGEPPSAGAVLVPPAGQTALELRILGREGAPLPGAIVRALRQRAEGQSVLIDERVASTNGEVEFRLPACTPLLIEARFPGLVARTPRVLHLARERVEVRLPASPRRALVVARARRLLDRLRRVQRQRRAILDEIAKAIETGDPDTVESLIKRLEAVQPSTTEWEGELLLIKEEAARYGENVEDLLEELAKAVKAVGQSTDTSRFREWVAARRRQLRVVALSKRARELTESMRWAELLDCYRELAELTGDEVARERAAYLEEALRERGPEHKVAREWVRSWVPKATLKDVIENQDLLELTTEQLISADDTLHLLVVQRSLERWAEAIQKELDRLRQKADSTTDPDDRRRAAEKVRQLGELAEKLASLLERIAPVTRRVPL